MGAESLPRTRLISGGCVLVLLLLVALAGLSCGNAGPFSLNVIPQSLKGESIPGQRCVFLVTIAEEKASKSDEAVSLSVALSTPEAEVAVVPSEIVQGQVAEVTVIPTPASVGETIEVAVRGTRDGLTDEKSLTFTVAEGEDDRSEYAAELRDRFTSWLAANQPDLGITPGTEWVGTMVSPVWLVVSYYLFFSEEWEMHIEWHIMIAPDDWAKMDLRRRFTETKPSSAFEISSVSQGGQPHWIAPPEEIWR